MKKIVMIGVVGFGLVGCTAPKYNYQAVSQNVSKPPIGSVNEAYVGDKMLTQGVFTEREALHVTDSYKKYAFIIRKGYYLKTGEDANGSYYQAINNIPDGGMITPESMGLHLNKKNEICILTVLATKRCFPGINGKEEKISVANDNSFQQTLIYSGKVGNKINIGYREFSSSVARPAFNNDVEYDLNESKAIGYKGALLEVIDANNQSIKYKVLRNFNKAE